MRSTAWRRRSDVSRLTCSNNTQNHLALVSDPEAGAIFYVRGDRLTATTGDYVYSVKIAMDGTGDGAKMVPVPFRVTKITPKRVFYLVPNPAGQQPDFISASVNRQELENAGPQDLWLTRRAYGRRDSQLFPVRKAAEAYCRHWSARAAGGKPPDEAAVEQLRRGMLAAHPDRGGTAEDFIRAREAYLNARTLLDFETATQQKKASRQKPDVTETVTVTSWDAWADAVAEQLRHAPGAVRARLREELRETRLCACGCGLPVTALNPRAIYADGSVHRVRVHRRHG